MSTKYVFNPLTGNIDATDKVAFNGEVNLGSANAPSIFFTGDPNTGIYSPGADQLAISTNGTKRVVFLSDGTTLFNTESASFTSDVGVKIISSTTIPTVNTVVNTSDGGINVYNLFNTNAVWGGYRFYVKVDGGIANFSANNANLSDRNAKTDITFAEHTWDCLKQWEIVRFRYKGEPSKADLNLGVIAQQIQEVCPEVVTIFQAAKEATETEEAQEERLGVKEQQMMWMAIKALQEAQLRIETLEAKVAALES